MRVRCKKSLAKLTLEECIPAAVTGSNFSALVHEDDIVAVPVNSLSAVAAVISLRNLTCLPKRVKSKAIEHQSDHHMF